LTAELERHLDQVRALSKPGQALVAEAPTATVNNSAWFGRVAGKLRPRRGRTELHQRLLRDALERATEVQAEGFAIVLAGPPGAGKSTTLDMLLEREGRTGKYLEVNADHFKEALLREALADGSYDSWIKPQEVKDLEAAGERFLPLELAALVHEESSLLAVALREEAIASGLNIVVDSVLANEGSALQLGQQLVDAGYRVRVIDVEVPYSVSEERIRGRWREAHEKAGQETDGLGGRWVPSEYARDVFSGPGGAAKSEAIAYKLAQTCPAVSAYQLHRVTAEMVTSETPYPTPILKRDMIRRNPGTPLLERKHAEIQGLMSATRPPRTQRGGGPPGPAPRRAAPAPKGRRSATEVDHSWSSLAAPMVMCSDWSSRGSSRPRPIDSTTTVSRHRLVPSSSTQDSVSTSPMTTTVVPFVRAPSLVAVVRQALMLRRVGSASTHSVPCFLRRLISTVAVQTGVPLVVSSSTGSAASWPSNAVRIRFMVLPLIAELSTVW
jgi:hypothetical protein